MRAHWQFMTRSPAASWPKLRNTIGRITLRERRNLGVAPVEQLRGLTRTNVACVPCIAPLTFHIKLTYVGSEYYLMYRTGLRPQRLPGSALIRPVLSLGGNKDLIDRRNALKIAKPVPLPKFNCVLFKLPLVEPRTATLFQHIEIYCSNIQLLLHSDAGTYAVAK